MIVGYYAGGAPGTVSPVSPDPPRARRGSCSADHRRQAEGKEEDPLSGQRRLTALVLLMTAFLLVFPAQAAPRVRVYIPENALPLSLPQVPEAPALLRQGAAEDGAGFEIVFSAPVDSAVLLSGDTETPMTLSGDGLSARLDAAPAGPPDGFSARLSAPTGTLTVRYAPSGGVRFIELEEKGDRFYTGQTMGDPVTTIRWDCTVLRTGGQPYPIWRVSSVSARYSGDSYITSVLVRYQGDQTMSVTDYEITYSPARGEYYLIRYGKADHVVSGEYTDGRVKLINGSGRHFWDNTWYDAVTGRQSAKTGLLAFTGFDSPRVKTR